MKCIILTEGGIKFGFGHISRCTSFYDALQERNHEVEFVIHGDKSVNNLLEGRRFIFIKWHGHLNNLLLSYKSYDLIIFDSFHVSQEDINLLCDQPFLLVSIDDYLRNVYHDSIIIDWTVNIEKSSFHDKNLNNGNKVLLGIDNCVLRKQFWNKPNRMFKELGDILIMLGGSDIRGLTTPIITYLTEKFPDINFHIITGVNSKKIKSAIPTNATNYQLYQSVNSEKIKILMDFCDIAISAGGQTLYELAAAGLPTIAIETIENQREDILGWRAKGSISESFIWNDPAILIKIELAVKNLYSISTRKSMYKNFRNIINGDNVFKITDLIENMHNDKNRK